MSRRDSTTLGIDLNEREIRLVQAGVKGGRPFVAKAAATPLPYGAVAHGIVMEPATLIVALRRALAEFGVSGPTKAVIGVSGEQAGFRTVSVPPCPDAELPTLIAGEIALQGSTGMGGPYDFFPLFPAGAPVGGLRPFAVVDVDAGVTQSLFEIAEEVGLGVQAFEPTPLALLRTAVAELPATANAFALVVGPSVTDAAYFIGGKLAAFRRLDVGANGLVQSFAPSSFYGETDSMYGSPFEEPEAPLEGYSHIDQGTVDRLALEAQRTMEYVQRGDPEGSAIHEVILVADDPEVEPLAAMLERRFGLTVKLVRPPSETGAQGESRYGVAYGLALRAAHAGVATPAADLFSAHRTEAKRVETKRNFYGSLLVAGLAAAVGVAGCFLYNRQIAAVKKRSGAVLAQIAAVKKTTDARLDARADEALLYKTLRAEGVPLGTMMDYVVGGIDPTVGLKFVSISDDLKVRIAGEARDETALVRTTQALQSSPVLKGVAVERFDRGGPKDQAPVLTFEVSATTVPADRLKQEANRS